MAGEPAAAMPRCNVTAVPRMLRRFSHLLLIIALNALTFRLARLCADPDARLHWRSLIEFEVVTIAELQISHPSTRPLETVTSKPAAEPETARGQNACVPPNNPRKPRAMPQNTAARSDARRTNPAPPRPPARSETRAIDAPDTTKTTFYNSPPPPPRSPGCSMLKSKTTRSSAPRCSTACS